MSSRNQAHTWSSITDGVNTGDDYNGLTSDIFKPFYSMSDHLYIVFLMQCMDVRSN